MPRNLIALSAVGALGAAALAIPALAQDRAPRGEVTRAAVEQQMRERLGRIDANADGLISAEERRQFAATGRQARADGMFQRLDANRDGAISRAEFDAGMGQARRGGGMKAGRGGGDRLARSDQPVAIDDLVARRLSGFDRLDTDRNGVISADERRSGREARRDERRGRAG